MFSEFCWRDCGLHLDTDPPLVPHKDPYSTPEGSNIMNVMWQNTEPDFTITNSREHHDANVRKPLGNAGEVGRNVHDIHGGQLNELQHYTHDGSVTEDLANDYQQIPVQREIQKQDSGLREEHMSNAKNIQAAVDGYSHKPYLTSNKSLSSRYGVNSDNHPQHFSRVHEDDVNIPSKCDFKRHRSSNRADDLYIDTNHRSNQGLGVEKPGTLSLGPGYPEQRYPGPLDNVPFLQGYPGPRENVPDLQGYPGPRDNVHDLQGYPGPRENVPDLQGYPGPRDNVPDLQGYPGPLDNVPDLQGYPGPRENVPDLQGYPGPRDNVHDLQGYPGPRDNVPDPQEYPDPYDNFPALSSDPHEETMDKRILPESDLETRDASSQLSQPKPNEFELAILQATQMKQSLAPDATMHHMEDISHCDEYGDDPRFKGNPGFRNYNPGKHQSVPNNTDQPYVEQTAGKLTYIEGFGARVQLPEGPRISDKQVETKYDSDRNQLITTRQPLMLDRNYRNIRREQPSQNPNNLMKDMANDENNSRLAPFRRKEQNVRPQGQHPLDNATFSSDYRSYAGRKNVHLWTKFGDPEAAQTPHSLLGRSTELDKHTFRAQRNQMPQLGPDRGGGGDCPPKISSSSGERQRVTRRPSPLFMTYNVHENDGAGDAFNTMPRRYDQGLKPVYSDNLQDSTNIQRPPKISSYSVTNSYPMPIDVTQAYQPGGTPAGSTFPGSSDRRWQSPFSNVRGPQTARGPPRNVHIGLATPLRRMPDGNYGKTPRGKPSNCYSDHHNEITNQLCASISPWWPEGQSF